MGRTPPATSRSPGRCGGCFTARGYSEVVVPCLWEQGTFIEKAGPEILGQMYAFKDRGDRPICLIPEVTAVIREVYKAGWEKSRPKPVRVFYIQRCWRYDRPQEGRQREFTQVGVELLGGRAPDDAEEVRDVLLGCMGTAGLRGYEYRPSVKRGLDYYVEDGFEVECASLGAQKQVVGGGRYDCGIGFAIGVERLLLALARAK